MIVNGRAKQQLDYLTPQADQSYDVVSFDISRIVTLHALSPSVIHAPHQSTLHHRIPPHQNVETNRYHRRRWTRSEPLLFFAAVYHSRLMTIRCRRVPPLPANSLPPTPSPYSLAIKTPTTPLLMRSTRVEERPLAYLQTCQIPKA